MTEIKIRIDEDGEMLINVNGELTDLVYMVNHAINESEELYMIMQLAMALTHETPSLN